MRIRKIHKYQQKPSKIGYGWDLFSNKMEEYQEIENFKST